MPSMTGDTAQLRQARRGRGQARARWPRRAQAETAPAEPATRTEERAMPLYEHTTKQEERMLPGGIIGVIVIVLLLIWLL